MKKYTFTNDYDIDEIFSESDLDERLQLLEDKNIVHYRTKTIKAGNVLECEIYPVWNTRNSLSRAKKAKESRETQKRLNLKNAQKNVMRLINTNFCDSDIWGTFTYETKKLPATVELAQKEMSKFIRRLKYYAERHNFPPLKYVYTTEFEDDEEKGKKRVHHHIVINFPDRDIAEKLWRNGARTQTRRLQADKSGYNGLSVYIMKDPKGTKRYVTSKNLKKPQITISDSKFSRKRIKNVAINGEITARNVFENEYRGYEYITSSATVSNYVTGTYLYVKMYKKSQNRRL